ncbi:MAG: hypothetical protein ACHQ9S_24455 [Candidatus Binatia bacterium]
MSTDQSRLTWALILSVLLHGLILSLLPLARGARLSIPPIPPALDVDVVSLPQAKPPAVAPPAPQAAPAPPAMPVPKQQIVSPSDAGEEKEPENPRFLSDRNNTVKEEKIHRGDPVPGDPESKRLAETKPQAAEQRVEAKSAREEVARKTAQESRGAKTQVAALPKLDQLLPSSEEMIREGVVRPQEPESSAPAPEQHASAERTDLLRHGDPWRTQGLGGSRDFLPAVRDGDITMLNTKADQFAPFVRRVAVRVFENFVMLVRRSHDNGQEAAEEYATVEAVMDKQGQVVAIDIQRRSGSSAFATDRSLQAACREGFFDRNPPSGAEASDGKIHFVFDARVTLVMDRTGRRVPAWVMMGAGLL